MGRVTEFLQYYRFQEHKEASAMPFIATITGLKFGFNQPEALMLAW